MQKTLKKGPSVAVIEAPGAVSESAHPLAAAVGPSPLTQEHRDQGQAHRLLRAAVELFAERGFFGTTIRQICNRAGTGEAAVYDHFSSKQEMLYLASKIAHDEVLERLARIPSSGPAPAEMSLLTQVLVQFHAEWVVAARIANYELPALSARERDQIVARRRNIEARFMRVLNRGIADGVFDVAEPKTAVFAILSMSIGVSRWFLQSGSIDPSELGRIYSDLVLRMLAKG